MRFVTSKKESSPSTTIQRVRISAPTRYPSSDWSISATPPPCEVEFTCHSVRSANRSAPASSTVRKRPMGSAATKASKRFGGTGAMSTVCMVAFSFPDLPSANLVLQWRRHPRAHHWLVLGPAPRQAAPLLTLHNLERADRIGEFWSSRAAPHAEILMTARTIGGSGRYPPGGRVEADC